MSAVLTAELPPAAPVPGAPVPAAWVPPATAPAAAAQAALIRRALAPHAGIGHLAYASGYANFAPGTMQAHRLWIKLWIALGHPEENPGRPGGNAGVTGWVPTAAHRLAAVRTRVEHRACARPRRPPPAPTPVIPGIHRPYDDYQSSYARQLNIQVASADDSGTRHGATRHGATTYNATR